MHRAFVSLATLLAVTLGIAAVRAEGEGPKRPQVAGKVKSVDATAGTITLAGKSKEDGSSTPDATYATSGGTKITIDGEAKKLADVSAGMMANISLDADGKTAAAITIKTKKDAEKGSEGEGKKKGSSLTGEIAKLDSSTIVIGRSGDSGVTTDSFAVDADTKFFVQSADDEVVKGEGGNEKRTPKVVDAKASDFKNGQRVTVMAVEGKAVKVLGLRAAPKKESNEG